ncbi:ferrous iron transport protein A [Candidatus Sumerlaeota bacterium]|nr:ferrous iron transport protein A [Candidatus Sumerlaeota bacterium]
MTELIAGFGARVSEMRPLRRIRRWRDQRRAVLQGEVHPLAKARPGETLRVVGFAGAQEIELCDCFDCPASMDAETLRRVLEMGIVPGTHLTLMSSGDPVIIGLWGGRVALSRALACAIFVVPETGEAPCTCDQERAA